MATNVSTDAQSIAREFAAAIRDEPTVKQLWLAPTEDGIELYVVTNGADMDAELRISEEFGNLVERYPGEDIGLWLFDPRHFVDDAAFRSAVPGRATPVPLRD